MDLFLGVMTLDIRGSAHTAWTTTNDCQGPNGRNLVCLGLNAFENTRACLQLVIAPKTVAHSRGNQKGVVSYKLRLSVGTHHVNSLGFRHDLLGFTVDNRDAIEFAVATKL